MEQTQGHYPEARRYVRYRIRVGAEVQVGGFEFTCETKNLSLGGVGLSMDRPLSEGASVWLVLYVVVDEVEDEATPPLETPAKVIWCRQIGAEAYEAGLQFEAMEDAQRAYLEQFLALQREGGGK